MKKIAFIMLAFLGIAFALPGQDRNGPASVTNPVLLHLTNLGQVQPLLRESFDSSTTTHGTYVINLDTGEIDTGFIHLDILGAPIFTITDTLGSVGFTCKDSTGTDTIAVILKWQGNARLDGKGVWRNIDSLELKDLGASGAAAQGVYRDTTKYLVNTGGFSRFRFFLRNKLLTNANRKATCKDAYFMRRQRAGYRP